MNDAETPSELPDADELYSHFFDRWYTDDDRKRKRYQFTRPDMEGFYRAGFVASDLSRLTDDSQTEVLRRIQVMTDAAKADWPRYLDVSGELDEGWIQAFDEYYDDVFVAATIADSDPNEFSNDLVVSVCEFGAALGYVLIQKQPRLQWLLEWPYWESSLYDPQSGVIIPPFHWAMKKFSDYGIDDNCAEKVQACVALLDQSRE